MEEINLFNEIKAMMAAIDLPHKWVISNQVQELLKDLKPLNYLIKYDRPFYVTICLDEKFIHYISSDLTTIKLTSYPIKTVKLITLAIAENKPSTGIGVKIDKLQMTIFFCNSDQNNIYFSDEYKEILKFQAFRDKLLSLIQ